MKSFEMSTIGEGYKLYGIDRDGVSHELKMPDGLPFEGYSLNQIHQVKSGLLFNVRKYDPELDTYVASLYFTGDGQTSSKIADINIFENYSEDYSPFKNINTNSYSYFCSAMNYSQLYRWNDSEKTLTLDTEDIENCNIINIGSKSLFSYSKFSESTEFTGYSLVEEVKDNTQLHTILMSSRQVMPESWSYSRISNGIEFNNTIVYQREQYYNETPNQIVKFDLSSNEVHQLYQDVSNDWSNSTSYRLSLNKSVDNKIYITQHQSSYLFGSPSPIFYDDSTTDVAYYTYSLNNFSIHQIDSEFVDQVVFTSDSSKSIYSAELKLHLGVPKIIVSESSAKRITYTDSEGTYSTYDPYSKISIYSIEGTLQASLNTKNTRSNAFFDNQINFVEFDYSQPSNQFKISLLTKDNTIIETSLLSDIQLSSIDFAPFYGKILLNFKESSKPSSELLLIKPTKGISGSVGETGQNNPEDIFTIKKFDEANSILFNGDR